MDELNPKFEVLKNAETFSSINPYKGDCKEDDPETPKLEDYEYLRITDKTVIPYPVPILKINGDRVATPGAIVAASGAPKAGKSAFIGIVVAGAICANPDIDGLPGVEVLLNEDSKAVIHLDTEQDRYTHQHNQRTILKRANLKTCPDFYLSYNIRQLSLAKYQPTVNAICESAATQFGGIHSIFIDGAADFIKSVNDEIAAFEIVDYFEKLAQKYNTAIFVIIHTNPGSDKERGHLGSQFQRKSTGILSVKKEGDISYLDPKLMRFTGEMAKIQFKYDKEKGYHVACNEIEDSEGKKAIERLENVKKVCESVFSGQRSYMYARATDAIMKHTNKKIGFAKDMFSEMKAHEMIIQGTDKHWRINNSGMVV